MNAELRVGGLLAELWQDLQSPEVIWQVGVLLICFVLAWTFERWMGGRLARARAARDSRVMDFGERGMRRVGLPLAMLILVLIARPVLAQWHHINLLSLAVPLLTSMAVIRAVLFILRHSLFSTAAWLGSFERAFALLAWSVVALHIIGLLPEVIDLLESVSFTLGKEKLNLWLILQGIGAMLVTLLVALWVGGGIESHLMNTAGLDGNLRLVLSRVARAFLILLAVLIGLPLVGIDLTTLSVFGGALGVGLGFGLQKIAANYVSGFIILLDRSIRIGNLISLGTDRGVVMQITTRYTLLRGLTGIEMIVPNEMLIASVIANETFTDPKIRSGIPIQVAYGTDLDKAMAILVAAAQAQSRVLADPEPKAYLVSFADSGINLELGFWIADPDQGSLQLRSDIQLQIWRDFQAASIQIPFPQREVRML
ncbi:MAG: mechanosensitive ion channel [Rhodocyclaceae bacterium]|nr:mechanosensitive ion channel [Rhodocyclaceae bacterium]MDZ4213596.1 mechanosensitive ion channel [Rhodocyclaceae bacterium]